MVGPKPGNILGSFASIDLKEAEATLAATSVFKSGDVLGLKVHGGASEGLVPLLSAGKLNPKVGFDVQMNFLGNKRGLNYDNLVCEKYYAGVYALDRDSAAKMLAIRMGRSSVQRIVDIDSIDKRIKALQTKIDSMNLPSNGALKTAADSARVKNLLIDKARDSAQVIYTRNQPLLIEGQEKHQIAVWYDAEVGKLRDSLQISGFNIGWFSVKYGLENVSFRLFDSNAAFADQVKKDSYASHSVMLQYSRYRLTQAPFKTRFWSLGARLSLEDNLGDLDKADVIESRKATSATVERDVETKYSVYEGEYKDGLVTGTASLDYYAFLFTNNQAALHVYPSFEVKEAVRPSFSTGIGFIVIAKNKDTPWINAEVYINLADLSDTRDSGKTLIGRSGIGFRLSFPLTFTPVP